MKNIAVIPARGGSKGIKNKNLYKICGKSLIDYSIESLMQVKTLDDILVSTDSLKIQEHVNEKWPNVIVVKRPSEISGDFEVSESAIVHSINYYESNIDSIDNVLFVQCTSPLTDSCDFSEILDMLKEYDSVGCYVDDYGYFFEEDSIFTPRLPRQKRTPRKRECGNVWGFRSKTFKENKSRIHGNYGMYKIDMIKSFEIDVPIDVKILEGIIKGV